MTSANEPRRTGIMTADLDLNFLSNEERESILSVLDRDSALRKAEDTRIKELKDELRALRLKGVLKGDRSATQSCSRCCEEFGWLFNKGVICIQCLQKVCSKCHQSFRGNKVLCVFCMKQNELEAKCGNWFHPKTPRTSSKDKTMNDAVTGADVTRASLLRVRTSALSTRRSSAVGATLDDVRRALVNMPDVGGSFTSCDETDRKSLSVGEKSAFPQEDDKRLLKDLLDLRNFSLSSAKPVSTAAVSVRQVYGSKYRDSDSSDDDSLGEVDSPYVSSHSGSAYRKSDSIRSSLQTNRSSVVSSNGTANTALAADSFHESSSSYPTHEKEDEWSSDRKPVNQEEDVVAPRQTGVSWVSGDGRTVEDSREWRTLAVSKDVGENDDFESVAVVHDDGRRFGSSVSQTSSQTPHKTASELRRMSSNHEENNNQSPPMSVSSSSYQAALHYSDVNNRSNSQAGGSSLGSPNSTSMPSIAVLATNLTNSRNSVKVNGTTASDEENEDIGEMFAIYGQRRASSQTNLNKLSIYSGSKESINSCYSNAGEENYGKFPVTGEILFGLNYNYTLNTLEITIRRCKDLAAVDQKKNRSDPYIKTYLLPDRTKTGKRKTRVKKHTLNPVFDEILKYQIMKSELEARTLNVMVWSNDRFGHNDFLGEVQVPLDYYPFDNPSPTWHTLRDRLPSPLSMLMYKGDLNLCLKFVSAEHISGRRRSPNYKGELQVILKEARNLTAVRSNGFSDPFCKGYLLPDKSHNSKQKTAVVKKNCNPKWHHTFLFENVSWEELQHRSLELTVWDYDRLTSNDFLGGVRLNSGTGRSHGIEMDWMDAKGDELSLWQAMLDRPNCWIEGTLLLRMNMNQRK